MDPLWILVAFILGFAANRVGLPPMVGYLIAGFVLQAIAVEYICPLHLFTNFRAIETI